MAANPPGAGTTAAVGVPAGVSTASRMKNVIETAPVAAAAISATRASCAAERPSFRAEVYSLATRAYSGGGLR